MIIWALVWLYLRLEFVIDWGNGGNLIIHWLPTVLTNGSQPDNEGYRMFAVEIHFLIFEVALSYYYPSLYQYTEEGEVVAKNSYPQCTVWQMD